MRSLTIDVTNKEYDVKEIKTFSILDYSINEHLKDETYNKDVFDKANGLIISSGPFTGLGIPGAHRVIISGRSPLTKGFFFSTVGGVGEELYRTSLDSIKIVGKSKNPSVILIKYSFGKLIVKVKEIPNLFEIYKEDGVFSLQEYLVKTYADFYKGLRYRSIVAGISGFNTTFGGMSSVMIKNNKLEYGSEGFAGRGGYGSVLAQSHNIAGVMVGGDYEKEVNQKVKEVINRLTDNQFMKLVIDKTKKYRGDGTLLNNYENSKNDTLMFNWNNMFLSKEERISYYDKLIKNSYLKDYKAKKIISKTCGEACPASCKKVQNIHVKDFEPYSSCGPNLGIFTQDDAERVVNYVDALGCDAISVGNLLSSVFESLSKGIISTKELNLENNDIPSFNIELFNISDSVRNADIAIKLLRNIGEGKLPLLSKGIRFFSEEKKISNGVYFNFGSKGVISPNEYLRPGFVSPLPIVGKFTTFYGTNFIEPIELGEKSATRLVKELYNEDIGFCRFHRGWAEKIIPAIINVLIGKEINYDEHIKQIINKIIKYNNLSDSLPKKWNEKTKRLVYYHLLINDEDNEISKKWIKKFDNDFEKTIDEYWSELVNGINKVLGGEYKDVICKKR